MTDYISREAATELLSQPITMSMCLSVAECHHKRVQQSVDRYLIESIPAADVVPVSEVEKIIESLQEQADIYNARAQELLAEEDGQVSQYTWAVSLRETHRRIIKTLDDLIS